MNFKKHDLFYQYCGILMLVSEIWKQWTLTTVLNHGEYDWWYFPFQLCSIPMYICLLLPWTTSARLKKTLISFLMNFCLLGGIFVFFDTSGMHYGYAPLTIHSFAWHILLIILGIYSGLSKQADYSPKGYLRCVLLYLICCAIATIFNLVFYSHGSINMFYISPYYQMTQKVFCQIAKHLGNYTSIFIYILSNLIGGSIIHTIWRIIMKKTGDF